MRTSPRACVTLHSSFGGPLDSISRFECFLLPYVRVHMQACLYYYCFPSSLFLPLTHTHHCHHQIDNHTHTHAYTLTHSHTNKRWSSSRYTHTLFRHVVARLMVRFQYINRALYKDTTDKYHPLKGSILYPDIVLTWRRDCDRFLRACVYAYLPVELY